MVTGTRRRKVGVWWCGIVTTSPVAALECEELNTVMMKGSGGLLQDRRRMVDGEGAACLRMTTL